MGPATFVIAILGCGEGDAPCRELALAEPRFASVVECGAAADEALLGFADAAYPVLLAQCRAEGGGTVAVTADEPLLP
ncbi:MAG: hypothetical protein ACFBQW_09730, partial [Sphingomonadaceae bacterium]